MKCSHCCGTQFKLDARYEISLTPSVHRPYAQVKLLENTVSPMITCSHCGTMMDMNLIAEAFIF